MSLLLNALKKAEEGENKDGQKPASAPAAPASAAPASGTPAASAPAAAPAAPSAPAAPAPTPAPAPAAAAPTPPAPAAPAAPPAAPASAAPAAAAPAAPAARPGGLTGGGLTLKKSAAPPSPPVSSIPTPSTAAAERMAAPPGPGGISMGLKKAAAAAPHPPGAGLTVDDDDESRTAAARVFRGGGEEDEDAGGGPRFRGARNFLMAAALLVAIGGGGYFTLEAGLIPGVSTQSFLQLIGLQAPPPPPVASRQSIPELNVAEGEVLRLPRPAVDVQSEIDFTGLPEARASAASEDDREEYVQRIAVLTGYNAAREARDERERLEQEAQLAASLAELGDSSLAGLVDVDESAADAQAERVQTVPGQKPPLPDEVFTAAESRAEKGRIEAMTPSEADIVIISAAQKIAMAMAAEEEAEAMAMAAAEAAAAEEAAGDGTDGAEVAQADSGDEASAEDEAAAAAAAAEKAAMEKEAMMKKAEEMVAPSMQGEERRAALERAKGFYLSGRLDAAEAAYRSVLRRDANNLDAMRGLAQIALATGRRQLATTMYLRILDLHPRDPVSIAELANLQDGADPLAMERRIHSALGQQPESDARLYFALGNLYAQQALWARAQQAYFEAVNLEAQNPDYTYNLAVVLDYLNKPLLAARYYRQAVALAADSPSGFNLAQTRARIAELEQ